MKSLVILFAIFAIVAAFPEQEQERERRGILGGAALAGPWIGAPNIAAAPIAVAVAPKLLAAPAVVAAPALASPWGVKGW